MPMSKEESESYSENVSYTKALQEKKQTLAHNYAHDKIKLGL